MRAAARFALLSGLFLLVLRNAADFGEEAKRCATADRPNDLPNLGRKAAFSISLSMPVTFVSFFVLSPLRAAWRAAAYLLYFTYLPGRRPFEPAAGEVAFFSEVAVDEGFVFFAFFSCPASSNSWILISAEIVCDGIFVSVGREPETRMIENQVVLDENGYIIADESTKTNLPGVFAVGDIRTKALRQIVTATADGANAPYAVEEYLANK